MKAYEVFDSQAQSYDAPRRRLIPRFEEFYHAVEEMLPFDPEDSFRVLDLGAGTGLLSHGLKQAFPNCSVTIQDASENMLAVARERFAGDTGGSTGGEVSFLKSDYTRDPLPRGFHAVVSALSIHHLTGPEKQRLFEQVAEILEPGGVFVNADQRLGDTPRLERIYHEHWLDNVRRTASPEEIEASLERKKADKMSTLGDQLRWLEAAGFRDVDCRYAHYSFVVFGGFRGQ